MEIANSRSNLVPLNRSGSVPYRVSDDYEAIQSSWEVHTRGLIWPGRRPINWTTIVAELLALIKFNLCDRWRTPSSGQGRRRSLSNRSLSRRIKLMIYSPAKLLEFRKLKREKETRPKYWSRNDHELSIVVIQGKIYCTEGGIYIYIYRRLRRVRWSFVFFETKWKGEGRIREKHF